MVTAGVVAEATGGTEMDAEVIGVEILHTGIEDMVGVVVTDGIAAMGGMEEEDVTPVLRIESCRC